MATTTNLSTLKIHKLTKAQYDRELANGTIDENALYITPDEEIDLSGYATTEQLAAKADLSHTHSEATQSAKGFMSVSDKVKLDGISANAASVTIKTWTAADMT